MKLELRCACTKKRFGRKSCRCIALCCFGFAHPQATQRVAHLLSTLTPPWLPWQSSVGLSESDCSQSDSLHATRWAHLQRRQTDRPSFLLRLQDHWGPRLGCGMAYFLVPQSPSQQRHRQSWMSSWHTEPREWGVPQKSQASLTRTWGCRAQGGCCWEWGCCWNSHCCRSCSYCSFWPQTRSWSPCWGWLTWNW